jgi:CRISPR-associated protein Cas2
MMVIVSYDVAQDEHGTRRLRKVAKICQGFGRRVQYSVFECLLDPAQWATLRACLLAAIDEEYDSLRFYFLGANWRKRVEHVGAKALPDPEGPLIV